MARLIAFLLVVALAVGGALFLISERAAVTHAGYRVARLEGEHRRLVEANRKLEAQVAQLRTPAALAGKVKDLQLELIPPEQLMDQQLARAKEEEKARAKAAAVARSRAGH